MSQEKVDRNKELKKNRKKIVKRNKVKNIIGGTVGVIVLVAVIGWIGYSVYGKYEEYAEANVTSTAVDITPVTGFLTGLEYGFDTEE